jgi:hypothetical protein
MLLRSALVAVGLALGAPAVASAAADIEGVWSFSGGQIAVKAEADGTLTGWVIRPTVFDQCPHVIGEEVWADMTPQGDGSYFGKHQWFNSSTCAYTARGNTAYRVLIGLNQPDKKFLRVCFSPPENPESQPTIAPDGTDANTLRGCVDSDLISALPAAKPTISTVSSLPTARRSCRSSTLRLRLKQPPGDALKSVRISMNGRRATSLNATNATGTQTLTHVPRRRVRVRVQATTVLGQTITGQRTYRACK